VPPSPSTEANTEDTKEQQERGTNCCKDEHKDEPYVKTRARCSCIVRTQFTSVTIEITWTFANVFDYRNYTSSSIFTMIFRTSNKTVGSVAIVISVLFTLALERGAWKRGAGGVWVTVVGSHQTVVAYIAGDSIPSKACLARTLE